MNKYIYIEHPVLPAKTQENNISCIDILIMIKLYDMKLAGEALQMKPHFSKNLIIMRVL